MATTEEILESFAGSQFGGPSSITVRSDSGQPGTRGTRFLLSDGDPSKEGTTITYSYLPVDGSLVPIVADAEVNDVCINLNPLDLGYLDFYQYREPNPNVPSETLTKWYREVALTPNSFPYNTSVTFSSGVGSLSLTAPVPTAYWTSISAILSTENPVAIAAMKANLLTNVINIQHNIISDKAIASNILPNPAPPSLDSISFDTVAKTITFDLSIFASEYSSESWSALSGVKTIHLIISLDDMV